MRRILLALTALVLFAVPASAGCTVKNPYTGYTVWIQFCGKYRGGLPPEGHRDWKNYDWFYQELLSSPQEGEVPAPAPVPVPQPQRNRW